MRNRITNCFMGISSQPSLGGPTYFVRNVMYNVVLHAFKLHRGSVGDVGLHNTVVKNGDAFSVYSGVTALARLLPQQPVPRRAGRRPTPGTTTAPAGSPSWPTPTRPTRSTTTPTARPPARSPAGSAASASTASPRCGPRRPRPTPSRSTWACSPRPSPTRAARWPRSSRRPTCASGRQRGGERRPGDPQRQRRLRGRGPGRRRVRGRGGGPGLRPAVTARPRRRPLPTASAASPPPPGPPPPPGVPPPPGCRPPPPPPPTVLLLPALPRRRCDPEPTAVGPAGYGGPPSRILQTGRRTPPASSPPLRSDVPRRGAGGDGRTDRGRRRRPDRGRRAGRRAPRPRASTEHERADPLLPRLRGAFTGGVFVAAADLDGDGFAEVVVSPGRRRRSAVQVRDGKTSADRRRLLRHRRPRLPRRRAGGRRRPERRRDDRPGRRGRVRRRPAASRCSTAGRCGARR